MATERRDVRPYVGLGPLESLVGEAVLEVGGGFVEPGGRSSLSPTAFLTTPIRLHLQKEPVEPAEWRERLENAVDAAGLPRSDVELIVVASTPRLKISDVVAAGGLGEAARVYPVVELARGAGRSAAFLAPFGGFTLDFMAVLARDMTPKPLRPSHRGTWLARSRYTVKTDLGDQGFTPTPLTDEIRKKYRLSSKTMRYATVDDAIGADSVLDAVMLYVDDRILAELAQSPHTPGARSFQRQMFLDAMWALASRASKDLDTSLMYSDVEDSLLGRLISKLPTDDDRDGDVYLRMARDDVSLFMAHVEALVTDLIARTSDSILGGN